MLYNINILLFPQFVDDSPRICNPTRARAFRNRFYKLRACDRNATPCDNFRMVSVRPAANSEAQRGICKGLHGDSPLDAVRGVGVIVGGKLSGGTRGR